MPDRVSRLAPIRQRAINEALPADSRLRLYMAGKIETGSAIPAAEEPRLRRLGPPFGRQPRTLLVMPPITVSEGAVKRVIPPLGLLYLAATLSEAGYPVTILDCVASGVEYETELGDRTWRVGLPTLEIERRVRAARPDVVGISVLYSSDVPRAFEVSEVVRRAAPTARIVVGGLHASIYPEDFLSRRDSKGAPLIDFVVRGEGEYRLLALIQSFEAGQLDIGADGLCGRIEGQTFVNPQRGTILDLDKVALPLLQNFEMEPYFRHNVPFSPFPRGERVAQILTSRGCPIGCTFCASTNFQKAYRTRSVQNVMNEIRLLRRAFEIDELQFADDNLTFHRARALDLFRALRPERLGWCTPNGIMVATLDGEMIDAMVDSGMYQITLSLDGGTERTLRERHRKPLRLDRVPALVRQLENRGVLMHGTLVIGSPGESEDEIREGFDFVSSLPFTSIGVFIAQPLPGSELYEKALSDGRITAQEALRIDTARAPGSIGEVEPERLERLASEFVYEFNKRVLRERPDDWSKKYGGHLERLQRVCVGRPAPNTDGIIAASRAMHGSQA